MMSRRMLELVGLTLGSYLGYIVYSIYQERIIKTPYLNIQGTIDKFTYPTANAIFPSLCCFLFGSFRRKVTHQGPSKMPIKQQMLLGAIYSVILLSINSALIYLNYPTQLILGNLRLLAIFFVGKFCSRIVKKTDSKHGSKLFIGLYITIGIFMFNYEAITKTEGEAKSNYLWGVFLMVIFLLAEGFIVDSQTHIKMTYSPSSNDLFTSTNKYTFLFSVIWSLALGQLIPMINFIFTHPSFAKDIAIFSIFGVMGQFFMYEIIKRFESYLYAIMTVFRKILMVIISIYLYGHETTVIQVVGMIVVFSGLIYEVRIQMVEKKEKV